MQSEGFIIDVFSYSNENPYRIILDNDIVEDLTLFNASSQISIEHLKEIEIISNIETTIADSKKINFFTHLPKNTVIWIDSTKLFSFEQKLDENENYLSNKMLKNLIGNYRSIYTAPIADKGIYQEIIFNSSTQPSFNKNFEILIDHLDQQKNKNYKIIITASSDNQIDRLKKVFLKTICI